MKNTLTVLLFALVCSSISAQEKGFYLRGGLGYNFPVAGQMYDNSGFPFNGSYTSSSAQGDVYDVKNASFSSGLHGQLGLGYMFNKYLGIQLDMSIGLANTKYTGSENNIVIQDTMHGNVSITQYASTPVLLMPSIVLQNGGSVFNVYARAGVAVPLNTKLTQEVAVSNLPGSGAIETDVYTYQLKNSFAIGFTGAMGLQYNTSERIGFWAEINMLSMSLNPRESDLKSITVNGAPYPLSAISPSQLTIQYSKSITVSPGTNNQQPTYSIPFSNVGIHLGMTIKFQHEDHSKGRYVTPRQFHRD